VRPSLLEWVRPRALSLITTHQCTAACDHCCFACSPRVTKRIPPDRLRSLIDEARDVPSLKTVSFVGGECFLLGEELDDLMRAASGYGYQVACVTNGYWAVNRKAAVKRMERSAGAGLRTINLSTGEMHAKYVPPERIIHGAVAAYDLGMVVFITIERFVGTTFDWRAITHHPEIAQRRGQRLGISFRTWIPNAEGKGDAVLRHGASESRFRKDRMGGCAEILQTITVTPDLVLVACSGYPLESIPDLHLGSVANRMIADVLESAPYDFLKILIHAAGPEFMLTLVKELVPEYDLPRQYAHPCQTCLHMHRDPVAMAVLREHADKLEPAVIAELSRRSRRKERLPATSA
jgi:hypothetical protein